MIAGWTGNASKGITGGQILGCLTPGNLNVA